MSPEADTLIAKLVAGELTPEEQSQFSQMLAADPELRSAYQDQIAMHAMLVWRYGNVRQQDIGGVDPAAVAEMLEEVEQAARKRAAEELAENAAHQRELAARRQQMREITHRHTGRRPEPIVIPYSVAYMGAAAIAASLLWVAFAFFPGGENNVAVAPPAPAPPAVKIATVTDSLDAKLHALQSTGEQGSPQPVSTTKGTRLPIGLYRLSSGVLDIEFDGGAKTLVEAPATIELVSGDRIRLTRGRLVGDVPPRAIGFTVQTPNASIVDLGTEFGISIADGIAAGQQVSDISVFHGAVEVVASPARSRDTQQRSSQQGSSQKRSPQKKAERQRLVAGSSTGVDAGGEFVSATTSDLLYFRTMPSESELQVKIAYERWLKYSQKIAADPDVVAYYTFNEQSPNDQLLLNRAGDGNSRHGDIQGAQWAEGRWPRKQALRFAGEDPSRNPHNFVRMKLPEQFKALTIAAWVNVDAMAQGRNSLLLSEDYEQLGSVHWQLTDNGLMHVGLRTGQGNSLDSFGLNLDAVRKITRLKQWVHLAMVFQPEEGRITFYVDGKSAGARGSRFTGDLIMGDSLLGSWEPPNVVPGRPDNWSPLHGRIDELLVARRAFASNEIGELYRAGRP